MLFIFESVRSIPEKYEEGSVEFFLPISREENIPIPAEEVNVTLPLEEPELRILRVLFSPVPCRLRFLRVLSFAMVNVD